MSVRTLTGTAHAKVNLGLEILRKRPDGYHDLATVFCPIDLSDEITCDRTEEGISLSIEGIAVPADASNLCVRAAELLLPLARTPVGARISLTKRIPVGAGLGGGSSDAACVLKLLNLLWELNVTTEQLTERAVELGADVPYFVRGGLCFASGIGEQLQPLDLALPFWIVTVVPPEHVSTAWAYGQIRARGTASSELQSAFPASFQSLPALDDLLVNDFEDVVLPAYPAIGDAMTRLRNAGLSCVRMSGSGAAVFGLTDSADTARTSAALFSPPYVTSVTAPGLS